MMKTRTFPKNFTVKFVPVYLNLVSIQVKTVGSEPKAKHFLNLLIGLTILVKELHLVQIQPQSFASLTSVKYSVSA